MPYTHKNKKIPRELDRRVKYTDEQKERVKQMYEFDRLPQRQIARETGISRRLVSFILFPDRYDRQKMLYKQRRKDKRYYDKEKHTEAMRVHRRYKQTIKDRLV